MVCVMSGIIKPAVLDSSVIKELLEEVASGSSLIDVCRSMKLGILEVRALEMENESFRSGLELAMKFRSKYFLERRAQVLSELSRQVYVIDSKGNYKKASDGSKIVDPVKFEKFLKYSEKFGILQDREQDVIARRGKEREAEGGRGGGVPMIQMSDPFAGKPRVDLDRYRVESNLDEEEVEDREVVVVN